LTGDITMANQTIMNIAEFKKVLSEIGNETGDDYEIWLSCDEEGNEFLPMFRSIERSMAVDKDAKRIIFFPSHR
jgi:hypothetical protein